MLWIKNTAGKKDAMLTFAFFSFFIVTLNILLSTFGAITVGDFSINFQVLDGGIMAVYLGATFTAYVSRRLTDKVYVEPEVVAPQVLTTEPKRPVQKNYSKPTTTAPVEFIDDDEDDVELEYLEDIDNEPTDKKILRG